MTPKTLAACTAAALALAVTPGSAGAASLPSEAVWRPWADLLQADPYRVPEAAAGLRGVAPVSRCGTGSPDLAAAVARLGAVTGAGTTLAPALSLDAPTAAYVARVTDCVAAHVPHLPAVDGEADASVPDALRAAWLGALTDLAALAKEAPDLAGATRAAPACADSLCLVQVGTTGDDTYDQDAVVIVDPGGSDTYTNNTAGAPVRVTTDPPPPYDTLDVPVPVSLLLDLGAGADSYQPETSDLYGLPTNGAGRSGGVGVLVDDGGDDYYCGYGGTMGAGSFGAGLLLDLGGDDVYESFDLEDNTTPCGGSPNTNPGQSHKLSHGAGQTGYGFLVDAGGSDTYVNDGVDSLGWGAVGGLGLLLDASGADRYEVHPDLTGCGVGVCGPMTEHSGVSIGVGEVQGVGVLLDGGLSPDTYGCYGQMNYACIGASFGGVLGLLYDDGGDDSYHLADQTKGYVGGIGAAGAGLTAAGTDGTPGAAVFVDVAGDDTYTSVDGGAAGWGNMAPALFLDVAGTDTYAVPGNELLGTERGNGRVWVDGSDPVVGPEFATGVGVDLQ